MFPSPGLGDILRFWFSLRANGKAVKVHLLFCLRLYVDDVIIRVKSHLMSKNLAAILEVLASISPEVLVQF